MTRKKTTKLNWNLVSLIAGVVALTVSIVIVWNQKKIDNLQDSLSEMQIENNKLLSEIDPSWHVKFNEQREFYNNQLNDERTLRLQANRKVDSLILLENKPKKGRNGEIILNLEQAKIIAIRLIDGERDSALLAISEDIIKNQDTTIALYDSSISNLRLQIKGLMEIIKLNEQIIENYDKIVVSRKQENFGNIFLVFLLGATSVFATVLFFFSLKKQKKP